MLSAALTLRVLVVDDNRDAADSLADLLRMYGADVRVCYDAEAALALVETIDFQAGVLDIHMPGIDGCELARQLRNVVMKRMLLVAMTGVSDDLARQSTTAAGFDLHLTKSCAPDVLVAALAVFAQWVKHTAAETPPDGTPSATYSSGGVHGVG